MRPATLLEQTAPTPSRRILALVALLALAALPGCFDAAEITLTGHASFNDKLRPDLRALSPEQVSGPPHVIADGRAYFSDGGADGSELVSEVSHSLIEPEQLRTLRSSRCLWVGSEGYPTISYDAVIAGFDTGGEDVNIDTVSGCGLAPNHPVTREVLTINGTPAAFEFETPNVSVGLYRYTGNRQAENPYGACDGVRPPFAQVVLAEDLAIGEDGTNAPFCAIRSGTSMPMQDSHYRVDVVDPSASPQNISSTIPELTSTPRELFPHLKVVGGSRKIARPLEFFRTRFSESDQVYVHEWTWRVDSVDASGGPDDAGPFWRENYAPHVTVDSVRVFLQPTDAPAPESERVYVRIRAVRTLEEGEVGDVPGPNAFRAGCSQEESGDEIGDGPTHLLGCGIAATPTYALVPDVSEKLEWRVQFETPTLQVDPPALPGDRLFIEFTLASAVGTSVGALRAAPAVADFGDVDVSQPQDEVRSFQVQSIGSAAVLVESIGLEGDDADAFSFEIADGLAPPFVVAPGSSVAVGIRSELLDVGPHRAELVVHASDVAGPLLPLRGTLVANGVSPQLSVAPSRLTFYRGTGFEDQGYWQKIFLVENAGSAPLERQALQVRGSYGSYFSVTESDCGGSFAAAPATCLLAPGESELARVIYHPQSSGAHDARVEVWSSVGLAEVSLYGSCSQGCSYGTPLDRPEYIPKGPVDPDGPDEVTPPPPDEDDPPSTPILEVPTSGTTTSTPLTYPTAPTETTTASPVPEPNLGQLQPLPLLLTVLY